MRRCVAALLMASACGGTGSPVGPTPRPPPVVPSDDYQLTTGPQWLEMLGFGRSDDPDYPPCVPDLVPHDGTNVVTMVALTREGQEWVARSVVAGSGDLELRFHESGQSLFGRTVTGTIHGLGVHMFSGFMDVPLRDVRIILGGPERGASVQVEGTIARLASFVLGSMSGEIRFSDSYGNFSTCSKILWTIQPATGPSLGP